MTDLEQAKRCEIVLETRSALRSTMPVECEDETSMVVVHPRYYLQISFSVCHPLMIITLARALEGSRASALNDHLNDLNVSSILGCHAYSGELGCYIYRATQWLEDIITPARFQEILDRCTLEADRASTLWESRPT